MHAIALQLKNQWPSFFGRMAIFLWESIKEIPLFSIIGLIKSANDYNPVF